MASGVAGNAELGRRYEIAQRTIFENEICDTPVIIGRHGFMRCCGHDQKRGRDFNLTLLPANLYNSPFASGGPKAFAQGLKREAGVFCLSRCENKAGAAPRNGIRVKE